jgi:hypothetical protein
MRSPGEAHALDDIDGVKPIKKGQSRTSHRVVSRVNIRTMARAIPARRGRARVWSTDGQVDDDGDVEREAMARQADRIRTCALLQLQRHCFKHDLELIFDRPGILPMAYHVHTK